MSVYAISFRIRDDASRKERYDSLVEKVEQVANGVTWDETTSFYVLECDLTTVELANRLYYDTSVLSEDLIVVINLSINEYETRGTLLMEAVLRNRMLAR